MGRHLDSVKFGTYYVNRDSRISYISGYYNKRKWDIEIDIKMEDAKDYTLFSYFCINFLLLVLIMSQVTRYVLCKVVISTAIVQFSSPGVQCYFTIQSWTMEIGLQWKTIMSYELSQTVMSPVGEWGVWCMPVYGDIYYGGS